MYSSRFPMIKMPGQGQLAQIHNSDLRPASNRKHDDVAERCVDRWHLARRPRLCPADLPLARLQHCGLGFRDHRFLPWAFYWRREHDPRKVQSAFPTRSPPTPSHTPHRHSIAGKPQKVSGHCSSPMMRRYRRSMLLSDAPTRQCRL